MIRVLRLLITAVLAIGLASLMAGAVTWPYGTRPRTAWVAGLSTFSLKVALTCLVTAAVSFWLMPSPASAALPRRYSQGGRHAAHPARWLLMGLAAAAALQAPYLWDWWTADRSLWRAVISTESDPLGFNAIPLTVALALPAIATILLLAFVFASLAAAAAPRSLAKQILSASLVLQAGLLLLEYMTFGGVQELARLVTGALQSAPRDGTVRLVIDWFARHDDLARGLFPRLVALLIGYVFALGVVAWSADATESVADDPAAMTPAPPVPPFPSVSAASAAFADSNYVVRARRALLGEIAGRRFVTYEIETIPPRSRSRFSFSWATGLLRREPSGPDVVRITAGEHRGWFSRVYDVHEPATAARIGSLAPQGPDWEVLDAAGRTVARVVQTHAAYERTQHVVRAANDEVCRLTWTRGGTVSSSEVEVEFLAGASGGFDRALPIALAPILEEQARRARRQ